MSEVIQQRYMTEEADTLYYRGTIISYFGGRDEKGQLAQVHPTGRSTNELPSQLMMARQRELLVQLLAQDEVFLYMLSHKKGDLIECWHAVRDQTIMDGVAMGSHAVGSRGFEMAAEVYGVPRRMPVDEVLDPADAKALKERCIERNLAAGGFLIDLDELDAARNVVLGTRVLLEHSDVRSALL